MKEEKKDCQEIGENKASKVSRDIWVFQEMQVKKENRVRLEKLVSPVSLDFLVKQEDQVILDYLVK